MSASLVIWEKHNFFYFIFTCFSIKTNKRRWVKGRSRVVYFLCIYPTCACTSLHRNVRLHPGNTPKHRGLYSSVDVAVDDCQTNQACSRNILHRILKRRTSQGFFSLATLLSPGCLSFIHLLLWACVPGNTSKQPCALWKDRIMVVGQAILWKPEGLSV